ncbi:MAG: transposase [Lysobacterales bacterium]|jgi:transposase
MGKYSKEFKVEAVRLLNEGEKMGTELAMELGVKRTLLYRWKDELDQKGDAAFISKAGRPRLDQQSELIRLKNELKEVKEERDILKKAAAYFARDLK